MAEALKNCPFCGRDAARIKGSWWVVECLHCTALGPGTTDRKGAIDAWNLRPTPVKEHGDE